MTTSAQAFGLRLEGQEYGGFVSSTRPRISWLSEATSSLEAPVQVELTIRGDVQRRTLDGASPSGVAWPFAPLVSRERGQLRVRSSTAVGWEGWSDPLVFETTLLDADDWSAVLIEPADIALLGDPSPVFQREFQVGDVACARLYISAHGVFDVTINGTRLDDQFLSPGWTAYASRLRFVTFDVTSLLIPEGRNDIEVGVGNGWYRGRLGWSGARAHYGDTLGLIAQLEVTAADGSRFTLATGTDWSVREGCIVADDIYDGTEIDFRRGDGSAPHPVRTGTDVRGILFPAQTAPVRRLARLDPVALRVTPHGTVLVDFGQNFTGWVSLRVAAHRGARVEVGHAEILIDGRLGVDTLRTAKATDTYILDSSEPRMLEPVFTFHGFRYAEIAGVNLEQVEDIAGVVIGSDLRRIGGFRCSDDRLNRLHENIVRSARSNLVDVPIDCPQRDERLGWTGDIQLFSPAASFLFDMREMLDGWLADLRSDQHADGSVPSVIPDALGAMISPGSARTVGFSDAAVLVPLTLYRAYGDRRLVERQWDSARRWVARAVELAGSDGIWDGGFQWGDWLDPSAPSHDPSRATTPVDLVATAALIRLLGAAAELADVAAPDEVSEIRTARARVADAFCARFVAPDGLLVGDSVSAYAFAVREGLLDAHQRHRARSRITALLRRRGFRASTGFLGTAQVLDALDALDATHIALRLLLTDRMPSWLAQVRLGATTVWERWNSMDDDGVVRDASMTSFNHYALGSVADWMHRRIGGLAMESAGYRTVRIAPILTSPLSSASVWHDSPYGRIAVEWVRENESVTIDIVLPAGVEAVVDVPGLPESLCSGEHRFEVELPARVPVDVRTGRLGDVLDDIDRGPELVDLLVRLGIVDDEDDAFVRLAPYADGTVRDLAEQIFHPAFRAAGPFVRRFFEDSLDERGHPRARIY